MKAGSVPTHLSEVKRAKFLCLSIHTTMLYPVIPAMNLTFIPFKKILKTLLNEGIVIIYYSKMEHTTELPF